MRVSRSSRKSDVLVKKQRCCRNGFQSSNKQCYYVMHYKIVEKSRAPRPYYVDHHEAVSHQDVTTDYLAQDTKGSVIITVSWFPGLPCK